MANQEITIQFEGYDDNTATYVVLTNDNDEIEEITDEDHIIETEQFDIESVYAEDIEHEDVEHVVVNGMHMSEAIETNDADIEIVAAPSGSRKREPGSRKRKYDDKEVEEWMIKLPVGIIQGIREPLRPYREKKAVKGDIETTKDGVKRRHDGRRWHRLCCVEGCERVGKKMGKCITHFNSKDDGH